MFVHILLCVFFAVVWNFSSVYEYFAIMPRQKNKYKLHKRHHEIWSYSDLWKKHTKKRRGTLTERINNHVNMWDNCVYTNILIFPWTTAFGAEWVYVHLTPGLLLEQWPMSILIWKWFFFMVYCCVMVSNKRKTEFVEISAIFVNPTIKYLFLNS